tara:strand:- start:4116 stop:4691 length:576 start_codon:yes stop_codon:yes gene_type:complete
MSRKVGIFGGSFDPVHFGHLFMAQDAQEALSLDELIFMPTAQSPLKKQPPLFNDNDRLKILNAAVAGLGYSVMDWEIQQGGKSYTLNTVKHLKALWPEDKLYWVIGDDQWHTLPQWHGIEELAKLISFIVVGATEGLSEDPKVPGLKFYKVSPRVLDISATEIRNRLEKNLSVDLFLPPKALIAIQEVYSN